MANSIAKNLSWTFLSRIGAQATQVLFSIFLARLLTPSEYGAMAMLLVLSGFAQILGEAGLASALIYYDKSDKIQLSTAFWIQASINLFFTLLFFFAAPLVADFYNNPVLDPLTRLMSINFIIQSVGQIQNAILAKRMDFKAIGITTYVAALVSSICAVVLAHLNFGVWALAWQALSSSITLLIVYTLYTRWWPSFAFSADKAKELVRYGLYLVSHNGLNYWMRNGDNLLIGRFLGATPLGIYNRAYTLMLLPLQNIGAIVGQVMFPTLSKLKDDQQAFRDLYCNSIRLISFVSFPIMAGLSLLSKPILLVLYGPQWVEAAPILQILSLVGLFQCIIFPVGWIFASLGKTREQFHISLFLTPLFFLLVGGGLRWGIMGVTCGYAMWAVISGVWNILAAGGLIGLGPLEYLRLVAKKVASTLAMMLVVGLSLRFLLVGSPSLVVVLFNTSLGAATFVAASFALRDKELTSTLAMVKSKVAPKLARAQTPTG